VAVFGRRFEVEINGVIYDCVSRGKKREAACGDLVHIAPTGPGQAVIEEVLPRKTFLERADHVKRKAIAANADQVLILTAVDPWFSDEFVTRVLLVAHAAGVPALIALNKIDLPRVDEARERLKLFAKSEVEIIELCAKNKTGTPSASAQDALLSRLLGRSTVLAGQSGMGKSTLVNALVPNAQARTGELSLALRAGTHTTTFSRLYRIDAVSTLIDCPGMQEVGLHTLDFAALEAGFAEFAPHLGGCRFSDCKHLNEPDCAVKAAVASGAIDERRYELFRRFSEEVRPASAWAT
jgi:ribosome biogenesis GTPase / thiamine phosphate phosphatase